GPCLTARCILLRRCDARRWKVWLCVTLWGVPFVPHCPIASRTIHLAPTRRAWATWRSQSSQGSDERGRRADRRSPRPRRGGGVQPLSGAVCDSASGAAGCCARAAARGSPDRWPCEARAPRGAVAERRRARRVERGREGRWGRLSGPLGTRARDELADFGAPRAQRPRGRGGRAARRPRPRRQQPEPDRASTQRRRARWPRRTDPGRGARCDRGRACSARRDSRLDEGAPVIAKITRGTRVGDIAAYLHGPGKADEHQYVKDGQRHSGGVVIASTIGAEGATDPAEWAADLRHTQQTRRGFAGREGAGRNHIELSRASADGEVWHGRNDRRAAQRAGTVLDKAHGLSQAPRRKVQPKRAVTTQREAWREAAKVSPRQRSLRRTVRQFTQAQWDALDPAVQGVIRTNSPQRVPGAHVPEPKAARGAVPRRAPASTESQYRQRARRTAERPQGRGYER